VSDFPFSEPHWFLLFFAVMWLGISGFLSLISGWSSLASRFPATEATEGKRFRFVSGSMGLPFVPVNYGSCLFLTINDQGFRLGIFFPFRFLSPPLFIPWAAVETAIEKRFLLMRYTVIRIRENWPILSLYGKAGKHMLEVHATARRP